MRHVIQGVCVLAIALGAGLFAFGSYWSQRESSSRPVDLARYYDHRNDEERQIASGTRGVGIWFMTLGALGLAVPWVNSLVSRKPSQGPAASLPSGPPA